MKKMKRNRKGQAIVEYIIIVVLIAVGALGIMGAFSDTIKQKMAGVINTFGGDTDSQEDKKSTDTFKELQASGLED